MSKALELTLRLLLPALAEALVALIRRLNAAEVPINTEEIAFRIVKGIEYSHPDWLAATKREAAREAIATHIERGGGKPKASMVNVLLELAVTRLKAEQAGA